MAEGLFSLGDVATAKGQLERIVAAWQRGDVPDGPMIIDVLHGLGEVRRAEGDPVRGDTTIRQALDLALAQGDRRRVPELRHSRGWALLGRGEVAEAEQLFEQALAAKRTLYAEKSLEPWDLANTLCGLGRARVFRGRLDEAMRVFEEAHAVLAAAVGEDHLSIATVDFWLGYAELKRGHVDVAEAWFARGVEVRDRLGLPADSPPRGHEPFDRAELRLARGDAAGAAAALVRAGTPADVEVSVRVLVAAGRAEEALALAEGWPPQPTNPLHQAWIELSRGRALRALGRDEEARPLLDAARRTLTALLGSDSPWTREPEARAKLPA
jgi:tetratricopeptide (TPR) repeat protein